MTNLFASVVYAAGQAPAQQAAARQPSVFEMLFPFIIIIAVFYLMVFMPQRKERKKREEMLKNLKVGDKVITSGGIYGEIAKIENDVVYVKVDNNVKLKMLKSVVSVIKDNTPLAKDEK